MPRQARPKETHNSMYSVYKNQAAVSPLPSTTAGTIKQQSHPPLPPRPAPPILDWDSAAPTAHAAAP